MGMRNPQEEGWDEEACMECNTKLPALPEAAPPDSWASHAVCGPACFLLHMLQVIAGGSLLTPEDISYSRKAVRELSKTNAGS